MRNRAAILTYATAVLQGMTLVAVPALSGVLKTNLRIDDTQYGGLFLPQVICTAVAALAGGLLARRWSLKTLLVGALLANALSQIMLLSAGAVPAQWVFAWLGIGTAALGFGFGLGAPPLNSLPGLLFPRRADTALVILHTLIGIGLCIGPLGASYAATHGAWTLYPASLAFAALVLAIHCALSALPSLVYTASDTRAAGLLRSRACWVLLAIAFLYAFAEGTFSSWAVPYLTEDRALSPAVGAFALSLFWGALAGGRLLASALILVVPAVTLWRALPFGMLLVLGGLPFAQSEATGLLAYALAGLSCSAFFPLTVAAATRRFPEHGALISSLLIAALMLGVGTGTFVIAPLRAELSLARLFQWSMLYPLIVITLCAWFVRDAPRGHTAVSHRLHEVRS